MPPPLLSELTARVAGEGDGEGPSVWRRVCTPLPWIEAKRSARPGSDDEGAPVTLAFPPGGGGGGGGGGNAGGGAGFFPGGGGSRGTAGRPMGGGGGGCGGLGGTNEIGREGGAGGA